MNPQLKKARRAHAQGKIPECEQLCQAILSADAECWQALELMAQCHASRRDFPRANILLERLLQVHRDDPAISASIYTRLGEYKAELGQPEPALEAYTESVRLAPEQPAYYARFISFLYLEGWNEKATELVAPFLCALQSEDVTVKKSDHVVLAQGVFLISQVCAKTDRADMIEQVQAVAGKPQFKWLTDNASFQFGMASLLDATEQYAQAWEKYQDANRLRRKESGYKLKPTLEQMHRIASTFDESFLQSGVEAEVRDGEPRVLFIVGLPRSGTSLTEQILASHSEVTAIGESPCLSSSLAEVLRRRPDCKPDQPSSFDQAFFNSVRRLYFGCIGGLDGRTVVTDKMPSNLMYLWLVRKAFPDAGIILCERQKLATVMSCFTTNFLQKNGFSEDLSDCINYFDESCRVAAHWQRALGDVVYPSVYEELVANSKEKISALLAYAQLSEEAACFAPHESGRVVKTASIVQVTQPIYQTGNERWSPYLEVMGESATLFD